jgi:hypothetical protein
MIANEPKGLNLRRVHPGFGRAERITFRSNASQGRSSETVAFGT